MEAAVLSSVAGPMSPLQAKAFYREWRSPLHSMDLKEAKNVKRTDPDRGLERIGRYELCTAILLYLFTFRIHFVQTVCFGVQLFCFVLCSDKLYLEVFYL